MVQSTTVSRLFCLTLLMQFETNHVSARSKWYEEKLNHRSKPISVGALRKLAGSSSLRSSRFEDLLDPILIPRVPGTENHSRVKQYLIDHMSKLGWNVETDPFRAETPYGEKPFENIIATLNPNVPRRLVLACHYDSKYSREGDFIGATDSAVPCAMLLDLAEQMQDALTKHKKCSDRNVTLQFIFFDGEEAFVEWNAADSIYGARHLAEKWQTTPYFINGQSETESRTNLLHRMDVLVLLDLLGMKNPRINNFFESTSHWHKLLANTEKAIKKNGLWSGSASANYFQNRRPYGGIEDDHVPFLQRGVDVLHIIPMPFPQVWHTPEDNRDALDFETIDNLNKIMRTFVAGYLHLETS